MLIGADGRVRSARELSGSAPSAAEALTSVQERHFIPISPNAEPIDAEKDVGIQFRLAH
jgi:hypothetical protein